MIVKLKNYTQLTLLLSTWFVVALSFIWFGNSLLWTILGILFWPILEYGSHYYAHSPWYIRGPHARHHEDRRDFVYQIVPQGQAISIAIIIWLIFGFAFCGGTILAYIVYEIVHELSHIKGSPRWLPWPFSAMVIHHLRHHARPNRCFAVTCPWMDSLFGTSFKQKK